jgi:hypothetical protein
MDTAMRRALGFPLQTGVACVLLASNAKRQRFFALRNEIGSVVRGKLGMLFRRFVLFVRKVGLKLQSDNKRRVRRGPLVSGTWLWYRHHARRYHGYYRTRR